MARPTAGGFSASPVPRRHTRWPHGPCSVWRARAGRCVRGRATAHAACAGGQRGPANPGRRDLDSPGSAKQSGLSWLVDSSAPLRRLKGARARPCRRAHASWRCCSPSTASHTLWKLPAQLSALQPCSSKHIFIFLARPARLYNVNAACTTTPVQRLCTCRHTAGPALPLNKPRPPISTRRRAPRAPPRIWPGSGCCTTCRQRHTACVCACGTNWCLARLQSLQLQPTKHACRRPRGNACLWLISQQQPASPLDRTRQRRSSLQGGWSWGVGRTRPRMRPSRRCTAWPRTHCGT